MHTHYHTLNSAHSTTQSCVTEAQYCGNGSSFSVRRCLIVDHVQAVNSSQALTGYHVKNTPKKTNLLCQQRLLVRMTPCNCKCFLFGKANCDLCRLFPLSVNELKSLQCRPDENDNVMAPFAFSHSQAAVTEIGFRIFQIRFESLSHSCTDSDVNESGWNPPRWEFTWLYARGVAVVDAGDPR